MLKGHYIVLSPYERSENMKQVKRWKAFLVAALLSVSLVGCGQGHNKKQEKPSSTAPAVTSTVSDESIYNHAYESYSSVTDLGVIINSPGEEELGQLSALEHYDYDKNASGTMLVIPKYNGTKITVSSVEYTGERYITKDVLYSVDATPEGYGLLIKADRPEGIAQIAIDLTYKEKTIEHIIETTDAKDGENDKEYLKVETEDQNQKEGDLITPEADAATYLAGLNCFSRYEVDFDKDGNDEMIEVYSDGKVDDDGHYLLDDGQQWTLILRKDNQIYPLFEKSYIQLGGLEYSTYVDYDDYERVHILVTYNTGSAIIFYDCTYDEESSYVRRENIYEANNVNKLKEWTYKQDE